MTELASGAGTSPYGESLIISWDANPEPDLHYQVRVGTQSGQYSQTHDVEGETAISIDQLEVGQTYYFVVVAIGNTGLESPPSEELAVTIDTPPLPTGSQLKANSTGELALHWTFPTSAMSSSPEFIVEASSDLVNWEEVATVQAENSLGGDGQLEHFSWPIPITSEERKFYRLTAKNWLGSSTAP